MTVTRTTREHARAGFWSTGLSVFVLWNLATLVGALAGNALGDPRTYGLDAAVGGAFLALLWPRLDSARTRVAALLAAALALALVPRDAAPACPCWPPRWSPSAMAAGPPAREPTEDADPGGRVIWAAVLACGVGCYLLKLAGMSVPERALAHPVVRRTADLLPVVLLAALVAVQVFAGPRARRGRADRRRAPWSGWAPPPWRCCCARRSSWWSPSPRSLPPWSDCSGESQAPKAADPRQN